MKEDLIEVKVKPNQGSFRIMIDTEKVTVELKSKPENNEANTELVKMFTKILKTPVYLVSGKKSKTKTLRIESMTREEVLNALKNTQDKHVHSSQKS